MVLGNHQSFSQSNNIFAGGNSDGYAESAYSQPVNNSIFAGGNGDGYDIAAFEQDNNNAIFAGGNGDGYHESNYQQDVNNSIFAGGNADGYNGAQFSEDVNNAIFAGGNADGYDEGGFSEPVNNSIFSGGDGDGYHENNYSQDINNSIFAGGNADGYDAQSMGKTTALPVELLYFRAVKQPEEVKLKWATATEKNAREFRVQKRMASGDFSTIVTKPAAGNSLSTVRYHAFDQEPSEGYNYYRLKEVDYDGSTQFSNIQAVYYGASPEHQIGVYPNPADDEVNVSLEGFKGPVNIAIYSMQGKRIVGKQYQSVDDEDRKNLELPAVVKSGVYLLKVIPQRTGQSKTIKLVVE
jgi:hypothetical protein